MANPRQRRKAKSSSHRPVSHSRRQKTLQKKTPPIRGPKVLRDSWDKKKTVRQNYAALGLVHSLNPLSSGGVEHETNSVPDATTEQTDRSHGVEPSSSTDSPTIPKGHGKIIRDESGNVVRVEFAAEDQEMEDDEDREKDMEELEKEMVLDGEVMANWVAGIGGKHKGKARSDDVVQELERVAVPNTSFSTSSTLSLPMSAVSVPRHASRLEKTYLTRLVEKHGADVDAMAKDRKANPEQRTAGELRRGLRRLGLVH